MATRLIPPVDYRTTDHSEEIQAFRDKVLKIINTYPDATQAPEIDVLRATLLMCAAALLEVHDATGISLDEWVGPRECVEQALMQVGLSPDTFIENHV